MDESAAKVRLDKADQPSEINCVPKFQLITEKEEAPEEAEEILKGLRSRYENIMA